MSGKTIVTKSIDIIIGSQTLTLPMINVAKGMYILKVIDGKGNTIAKQKIMKG